MLLLICSILCSSMGTCLLILHRGISPRKNLVMTKVDWVFPLSFILLFFLVVAQGGFRIGAYIRMLSFKRSVSFCTDSAAIPYRTLLYTLSHLCKTVCTLYNSSLLSVCDPGRLQNRSIHQASWIQIQILLSSSKIVRKTLIPTVLWLLVDFLSLKNDVNVPSKSNK